MTMAPWEPKRFFASGTWISHLSWEPINLTLAEAVQMQVVLYHSFAVWYSTGEVTGKMFKPELSWAVGDKLSGVITTTGESSLSVSR